MTEVDNKAEICHVLKADLGNHLTSKDKISKQETSHEETSGEVVFSEEATKKL